MWLGTELPLADLRGQMWLESVCKQRDWVGGYSVQLPTEEDVIILSDDSDSESEIFEAEEDAAAESNSGPSMGFTEVGFFPPFQKDGNGRKGKGNGRGWNSRQTVGQNVIHSQPWGQVGWATRCSCSPPAPCL